jgi:hypothetical protein
MIAKLVSSWMSLGFSEVLCHPRRAVSDFFTPNICNLAVSGLHLEFPLGTLKGVKEMEQEQEKGPSSDANA